MYRVLKNIVRVEQRIYYETIIINILSCLTCLNSSKPYELIWAHISCYSCRFMYFIPMYHIYPVSCLVEIKLFQKENFCKRRGPQHTHYYIVVIILIVLFRFSTGVTSRTQMRTPSAQTED